MTKTAPAPTQSSSDGSAGAIKAAVVIIGIGVLIAFGTVQGWWGGEADPSEEDTDQERVEVTWTVLWGRVVDTGEAYEDTGKPITRFECDERELTITTFVDGEPSVYDQYDSDADRDEEPCTFRWHESVPRGSELRMLVEEIGEGLTPVNERWKMCQIDVDGRMALPNGWAVQDAGGDCEVWGLAL